MNVLRSITIACLVGVFACASIDVGQDYDPAIDFGRYETFGWLANPQGVSANLLVDNPLIGERIQSALMSQLQAQGFRPVRSGGPDFLVGYHLSTEKKISVTTVDNFYGYDPYWGPGGRRETRVSEYDVGTLVIDVVDAASNDLIWRGWGKARLRKSTTPEKSRERVHEAVREILKGFPPKAASAG